MTLGDLDRHEGHSIDLKFAKKTFLNIFDNISDTIHSRIMRSSPKAAWGDLQNYGTFGDLDQRSKPQPLLEGSKMPIFDHFLQSLRHYLLVVKL